MVVVTSLFTSSEKSKDSTKDCGLFLHFKFDYNMEQADAFGSQVDRVDVYVFDESGYFVMQKGATKDELTKTGNRMSFYDELDFGKYQFFTLGNLTDYFDTTLSLRPGVHMISDVEFKLKRYTRANKYSNKEINTLWYGDIVNADYQSTNTSIIYPVNLIRETNRVSVSVVRNDNGPMLMRYSARVVDTNGATYNYLNQPVADETIDYEPYSYTYDAATGSNNMLSVCRLLNNAGATLEIYNATTYKVVYSFDLVDYVRQSVWQGAYSSRMTLDEYLDREGLFTITVYHTGGGEDEEFDIFIATGISINGWTVWFHDEPIG